MSLGLHQLDIKVWEFPVDNQFATEYLDGLQSALPLIPPGPSQLCDTCARMDFWARDFHIRDQIANLRKDSKICHFCKMRWEVCRHLEGVTPRVRFDRVESVIKMNESDPPVFSIFKSRGSLVVCVVGGPFVIHANC